MAISLHKDGGAAAKYEGRAARSLEVPQDQNPYHSNPGLTMWSVGWKERDREIVPVKKREGTEYVPLPEGATEIKAATVFNGMLIIACDNGPFYRGANGWERIG